MKKIATIFTALVLYISASAFNIPEASINTVVKNAFEKQFRVTGSVTWEKKQDVYFANFIKDETDYAVAFSEEGNLLALTRKVAVKNLPLNVIQTLNKMTGFSFDLQATEVQMEGDSFYLVAGQDEKIYLSMKCYSNGDIEILRRVKK